MSGAMRAIVLGTVLLLPIGIRVAPASAAACTDAAAVAAARAEVEETCDCATAANHGEYVACARVVIATLVGSGDLPKSCRGAVRRCAARSTCGRPGAVTCCRTKSNGVTKGSIKSHADACRAPAGGSACVGAYSSICDACDSDGCLEVACGNGFVDPGEECEPPGTASCDSSCQRVPLCGDGFVDGTEACDGAPSGACAPSSVCGAPGDALACQCCSTGDAVLFDVYAAPFDPAPCCDDGSDCAVYAPHFCSCE